MAKRKKRARTIKEEEEDESEVFQVEVIKKARVNEDGEWEYLVKWAGYDDPASDTWEPHAGVANCQRLLDGFWKEIGHDNDDHYPGDEFEPSQQWIEKEKRWFARNCKNLEEEKKRKKRLEEERREAVERAKKQRQKQTKTSMASASTTENRRASTSSKQKVRVKREETDEDDSNPDDGQAWPKSITNQINSIGRKRKRIESSDSESSGSDDVPLSALKKSTKSSQNGSVESKAGPSKAKGKGRATASSSRASSTLDKLQDNDKVRPSPKASLPTDKVAADPSRSKEPPATQVLPPKKKPFLPPLSTTNLSTSNTHPASAASLPGSGLSTKQRLAQGALAHTNPREKMQSSSDSTRPLSATKQTNILGNLSFKKKPAPVQASPTITAEDMAPRNLPMYFPHVESPSVTTPSTIPGSATASQPPKLPASLLRRVPSESPKIPTQVPQSIASSSRMSQDRVESASPAVPHLEPTLSSLNAAPSPIEPAMISDAPLTSFSPVDQPEEHLAFDMGPPSVRSRVHNRETEEFLSSIMPAELAAPLRPAEETVNAIIRPLAASASSSKIFLPSRIPKKYKWEGKIVLRRDSHGPETICEEGILTDVVSVMPESMPFKIAMGYMDGALELQRFYSLHHLDGILVAHQPAQEFARLRAGNEDDTASLKKLAEYLEAEELFVVVDVIIEGRCASRIVVYPTRFGQSNKRLKVRADLQDSYLVAALFTPILSSKDLPEDWKKSYHERLEEAAALWEPKAEKDLYEKLPQRPLLQHAVRIMQLRSWLHEYMSGSGSDCDRPYAIWHGVNPDLKNIDNTIKLEKSFLTVLLRKYPQAVDKGVQSEETLKAVFIHLSALKDIRRMPGLGVARKERIETMFLKYGSSNDTNSHLWGFSEIYPIGGVLTFTASALVKDPLGVMDIVDRVHNHELWCSYIIPPVLGMAAKLRYKDVDPLQVHDNGKFAYEFLLAAIDRGEISVMYAPPAPHSVVSANIPRDGKPRDLEAWKQLSESLYEEDPKLKRWKDPTSEWLNAQGDGLMRDPREVLEYCLQEFQSKYANIPESKWLQALEEEISNDLDMMQIQPTIMQDYRRFVVLRAELDEPVEQYRDGFEWETCQSFRFQDRTDDLEVES